MENMMKKYLSLHLFSLFLILLPLLSSCDDQPQVYIIYFGEHKSGGKTIQEIEDSHHSYLLSVKSNEKDARDSLLYNYKNSINGFAALLTADEASKLSEMEEVVSAFPSKQHTWSIQTTRSWDFMGLDEKDSNSNNNYFTPRKNNALLRQANYGENVIVGMLDSGIWPESKSFDDEGMGPVPKSWKGICQTGDSFTSSHCNRKIIGARYYLKAYEASNGHLNTTAEYRSPRDHDGHGTHTSSTVAGRTVANVSAIGGFARGTASGGAPLARLAIYKVCWPVPNQPKANGNTCSEADMLAAIDDAIGDGVDVLSISIGTTDPVAYSEDGIAIGALHAIKRNIVVACSAGNSGPGPATASNLAPWMITVGASSIDRLFSAPVVLGNGNTIAGQTVTPYKLKNKQFPLVYAGDVGQAGVPKDAVAGQCLPNSLSPKKAKGKIVLCFRGNGTRVGKGLEVKRAGGKAIILANSLANGAEISVDAYVLPGTAVKADDGTRVFNYIKSTKKPTAHINTPKTVLNTKPAPYMASFSSRGPNGLELNLLKPDITAPGLNILAAWSGASSPTKLESDKRRVKYNLLSGTSMSCPHVSAAAVLLKAIHPTWSSAAIRSALMTTAGLKNNAGKQLTDASGNTATPFSYGSGHLRPTKASDPGLIYDASYTDYLIFLCSSVGGSEVKKVDPKFKCPKKTYSPSNHNYPSLAISELNGTMTVTRTVTNVGSSKSSYVSAYKAPEGFSVKISPKMLAFRHVGEKKSFTITVKQRKGKKKPKSGKYCFGWYRWTDGVHVVRSPLVVSPA
ncbi:subtilisin-like protease SBT5.6 [Papaver somniferum]|uniref:subtilisin-like protease SBT5.6 n=1 Tax=Papaver somniferum TaxID=3469 RepID=UPI000E6FA42D|nr:subtilisin-like protease SBT5.6 [Papaver somniferum]